MDDRTAYGRSEAWIEKHVDAWRPSSDVVSFGPFRLFASGRRLEKHGVPVHIGGRALDILLVLAERPGDVINKSELIERVWPGGVVDEANLRYHIGVLRKSLEDRNASARYLINVSGRGYCLAVGPCVSSAASLVSAPLASKLPPRPTRIIGRDDDLIRISQALTAHRSVSIVGAGGIGKTTVALAIAHDKVDEFGNAIYFVDLSPLTSSSLVAGALASALGLAVRSEDELPGVVAFLRQRKALIVFDCCEHVIEEIAALSESLFNQAEQVYILATSREPLRNQAERVYRLSPLVCPPENARPDATEAMTFPAVQLFVACTSGLSLKLDNAEAGVVCNVCRRLDGIALAIELAASCVDAYGIPKTTALLDDEFEFLRHGRQAALPRHQTLNAMFDWSYNLLSEQERVVLRRLSIFVGPFSLDAAQSIASSAPLEFESATQAIGNLVAKSLISTGASTDGMLYRILDTTRAYVGPKLAASDEQRTVSRRHAEYFRSLLEKEIGSLALSAFTVLPTHRQYLSNVRAALEWCFSENGDSELGVALVSASTPLFLELSLLTECKSWAERALAALKFAERGTLHELALQAALGISGMFTRGNSAEAKAAILRGTEIAAERGDYLMHLRLLGYLNIFHHRTANYIGALADAQRGETVAKAAGDPAAVSMANWMLSISYHLLGDQARAHEHCEMALTKPSPASKNTVVRFGREHRIRALSAFARTLWLRGMPDQALSMADYALEEAEKFGHSVYLCLSLLYTGFVYLWTGRWSSAQSVVERLITVASEHSLLPYREDGLGLRGELMVKLGHAEDGIVLLKNWLKRPPAHRSQIQNTIFMTDLAEGLSMAGEFDDALNIIDDALEVAGEIGDWFYFPEILRIKGAILLARGHHDRVAEDLLLKSLDMSEKQSALAWGLRSATTLTDLYGRQGRLDEGTRILASAYSKFGEGFDTVDVSTARSRLEELTRRSS